MILSDRDIKKEMDSGNIKLENFKDESLTPNGYDLTVAEIYLPESDTKHTSGDVVIPAGARFLVSTLEYVGLGSEITAQLWIRTSWARKGIMSSFGKIDAGFEGTLTLAGFNSSKNDVKMSIGQTFAQVVFIRLTSAPEALYSERSGKYQGQKGVTLSKEG